MLVGRLVEASSASSLSISDLLTALGVGRWALIQSFLYLYGRERARSNIRCERCENHKSIDTKNIAFSCDFEMCVFCDHVDASRLHAG